jgi:AcrR family transcriptional regulator
MSPRPQKVTDDEIYMAAQRAMSRLGPNELTLAEIAGEAGVTAGLLVQRFGSKRDLLLALSKRFSGGTSEMFAELRRGHRSPLATLRAYSDCMAHMADTPAAFARNFAYLQNDLTDPDFRKHLARHAAATRVELQELIKDAIDAKELAPATNAKQLARTIETVVNGSMMSWAFYQEGSAAKWMRHDLDAVLKPYIPG